MQAERPPSSSTGKRFAARRGRPRAHEAGEIDRRILDAAADLFLTLGYEATSCDRVALEAGAGKASLYARYANKEELFAAVVKDKVERTLASPAALPMDRPLLERLQAAGESLLVHVLQPEPVAFMRVVVTTAHRMPELAKLAVGIGRKNGIRCIADAIVGDREATSYVRDQAAPVAAKFLDLAFVPHQMRALIGEEPRVLEADASARVADAIDLLSRAGWLKPWL